MTSDFFSKLRSVLRMGIFVTAIVLAMLGAVFVYLGTTGNPEFSLFGQSFPATGAGVAAVCFGAALTVLTIRPLFRSRLARRRSEGDSAAGVLVINNILLTEQKEQNTCVVDFRLKNTGGSEVLINSVELQVLEVVSVFTVEERGSPEWYDLDISELEQMEDKIRMDLSWSIKPGQAGRFKLHLIAAKMEAGEFRGWLLRPNLDTNVGVVSGEPFEVWLPYHSGKLSVAETKRYYRRMEEFLSGEQEEPGKPDGEDT